MIASLFVCVSIPCSEPAATPQSSPLSPQGLGLILARKSSKPQKATDLSDLLLISVSVCFSLCELEVVLKMDEISVVKHFLWGKRVRPSSVDCYNTSAIMVQRSHLINQKSIFFSERRESAKDAGA